MTYKYYSILRPISMGACPMDYVKSFANYSDRKYIPSIKREAWGEITYTRKLKNCELYDLEEERWEDL